MERARFEDLAGTWGGDLRRWPEGERAEAERLLQADPAAQAVLDEAAGLDALLDRSPTPWPSQALRDRIVAAAPRAGAWSLHWSRTGLAFGAGWAAAACAGVMAGLVLTRSLTADLQADAVLYQATLSGVDDEDLLG